MNTAVFGAYRPNPTFQHVPPIQIVPAVYATVAGDVIQLAVESDNNAIGQTSSLKGTSTEGPFNWWVQGYPREETESIPIQLSIELESRWQLVEWMSSGYDKTFQVVEGTENVQTLEQMATGSPAFEHRSPDFWNALCAFWGARPTGSDQLGVDGTYRREAAVQSRVSSRDWRNEEKDEVMNESCDTGNKTQADDDCPLVGAGD
jgi:hypothetical protein